MLKSRKKGIFPFIIGFMLIFAFTACDDGNGTTNPCASGHAYGEWSLKTAADCETAEVQKQTCSVCSHENTQSVGEPLGHDWEIIGTPTVAPTCETDGEGDAECTRCEATITGGTIPKIGHKKAETPYEVVAPTCEEDGYKIYRCIRFDDCDYTFPQEKEGDDLGGHDFTGDWQEEDGKHWKECQREDCEVISGDGTTESAKANHNWIMTANTPAKCEVDATETWACSDCNTPDLTRNPLTKTGTELEHTFTGAWQSDQTQHWKVCAREGCTIESGNGKTKSPRENHDMDWVETTTASYISTRIETYSCQRVGCEHTDGTRQSDPQLIVTSNNEFATVMESLSDNTADNPYTILINVDSLFGIPSFGETLTANANKFVNLDMSGSTFTSIGNYTFSGTGLTSITIPDSVTSIGGGAFQDTGLTSITIPDSVSSIGHGTFNNCTSLTSVTLPNNPSFTTIEGSTFSGCASLTSITIPDSVTSIGNNAFSGTGLTSITLPDSVTSIENYAFSGTGLTSITIPDSVSSIGDGTFNNCTSLVSVTLPNNPSFTSIGNYAFSGTGLTSITIPDSVISIGTMAFNNCTSLTSITLPDSVSSIGNYAFSGTGLTSITIPDRVTTIGDGTFYNCTSLASITLPNNPDFTIISAGAFYETGLTSIFIPASVTSIGDYAFRNCTSLTSVTLPNNNNFTSIEYGVFIGCNNLKSITIPDSVTSIGEAAFIGCTSLTSVEFKGTAITTAWDNDTFPGTIYIGGGGGTALWNAYSNAETGGIGVYTRTAGQGNWAKVQE